jgi:prolipoprotein diacylglyceryltransferase
MTAPWFNILWRIRCLAKGCCYGKLSNDWIGIRFTHPNSQVNKSSELKGAFLHPTQLYSIGTNLITGLMLYRFYNLGMSSTFITGMYFLLTGMGRFVEMSYRGEAQTHGWAGIRISQWIVLINILIGVVFTIIPGTKMAAFSPNPGSLCLAIAMGVLATIVYGIDFPIFKDRLAR